jgi:hypothetical protein
MGQRGPLRNSRNERRIQHTEFGNTTKMDLQSGGGEAAAEGQDEGGHAPGDAVGQQPADRSGVAAVVAAKNPDKVVILAKNVGNAPVLRTTQFSASASHPFAKVIQHIQVRHCCGEAPTTLLPACCHVSRRGPRCPPEVCRPARLHCGRPVGGRKGERGRNEGGRYGERHEEQNERKSVGVREKEGEREETASETSERAPESCLLRPEVSQESCVRSDVGSHTGERRVRFMHSSRPASCACCGLDGKR